MKTYEVLAKACVAEGVEHCFALLGDGNMHFASGLEAQGCNFTYARHEHCAVSMAMAYARVTQKTSFVTVTCGPGLTQVMTALVAAVRSKTPLVILAGEAPLSLPWYNQGIEQAPFVVACGASYYAVNDKSQLFSKLNQAFLEAKANQVPVVIGIPFDLQESIWTETKPYVPVSQWPAIDDRIGPTSEAVDSAFELIQASKNIILVGGRGVILSDAKEVCQSLALAVDALLASTLPARGLFWDDEFNLNVAGGFASDVAKKYFSQADLVIAVGTSLASHSIDAGRLYPKAKVLHIDTSPTILNQGRFVATHHLRADAKLGVQALLDRLSATRVPIARLNSVAQEIKDKPTDAFKFNHMDDLLDPRSVIAALDQVLPKDWMMVNSSGHCSYYPAHMYQRSSANFLTIREFGAIGNGLSYAIGAAIARPDVPVVLFDGDGGLMMHIQELETIKRHGLKILICVLNDGAYGSEIHKLRVDGASESGAYFGIDDLAALAKGFGLEGVTIRDIEKVKDAVDKFQDPLVKGMLLDFHISDQILSPVMRRITGLKIN